MKSTILFFVTVVFTLVVGINSAMAGKKPKKVIIANTAQKPVLTQPFCPCFTTEEIEAELAGPSTECIDDRVLEEGIGSITRMDSANALVNVSGKFDASSGYSYGCALGRIGMDVEFVVFFPDIGFTNMMACRLTIINSPSWKSCPFILP